MDKVDALNIMDKGRVAPDDEDVVGMDANGDPAGEVARIIIVVRNESWSKFSLEKTRADIPDDVLPTFFRKVANVVEGGLLGKPL